MEAEPNEFKADYGWKVIENEKIEVVWDTEDNIKKIRKRAEILLKGCKCKTGCKSGRCKCRREKNDCSEGCECINCENINKQTIDDDDNDITDTDDENDEQQLETDEFLDFWGDDNDETTDFTLI